MSAAERAAIVVGLVTCYGALGAGAAVHLGVAPTMAALRTRVLLVPALGVCVAAVVLATAATAGVDPGWWLLPVAAAAALASAAPRLHRARAVLAHGPRSRARRLSRIEGVVLVALVAIVGTIAYRFATTPLASFDGSFMWAYKIDALRQYGVPTTPAFAQSIAGGVHVEYPLAYPELQATALRIAGRMDEPLLRLHALVLHLVLALGAFALLAARVRRPLALATVSALGLAPFVVGNVGDLYVDAIVGWMGALAVLTAARALEEPGERWLIGAGAVFAAGAVLTKNEGLLGAAALALAIVAATWRGTSRRPYLAAAVVVAAAYAPYRVFRAVHGLHDADFALGRILDPGYLADRAARIPGTLATIAERVILGWPVVVVLALAGLAFALADGRRRIVTLGLVWALALVAGLVATYLATILVPGARLSANVERTTLQLVFGLALLGALAVERRQAP